MYSLDWPHASDKPKSTVRFKSIPEDFKVDEFFDYPFSGEGEHIVLKIEKRGLTTEEVVKSMSRLINKPIKSISYAGLKDRHALTTQWLSIYAPGEQIAGVEAIEASGWKVIECTRHNKKIRPGSLAGNRFVLTLREVSDENDLVQRIEQVKTTGVPNYFGEQRFGREGTNLIKAEELLVNNRKVKDRFLKGIYCSAARSWLFNSILAQRVTDATWNVPLNGDVMQLNGSHSIFVAHTVDDLLFARVKEKDISPASPLPGKRKKIMGEGEVFAKIEKLYADWTPWINGLEKQGLEEAWRANILHVEQLEYTLDDKTAQLSFMLPPGAYATAVLRELALYQFTGV